MSTNWKAPIAYLANQVNPSDPQAFVWMPAADVMSGDMLSLSSLENSETTLTFLTDADNIYDETKRPVFLKNILGGWSKVANKKITPLQHPLYKGMFATHIAGLRGEKFDVSANPTADDSPAPAVTKYERLRIIVQYQTLPFSLGLSDTEAPNNWSRNWLSFETKASYVMTEAAFGWYNFDGGAYDGRRAQSGIAALRQQKLIHLVVHAVPAHLIYNTPNGYNLTCVQDGFIGSINDGNFLGYAGTTGGKPTGQVCLVDAEVIPYGDFLGDETNFDVRLFLIWDSEGFNKFVTPGGDFALVKNKYTATYPYPADNLNTLLAFLNPK